MVLAVQPENVRAFYQLLFLLMLEFSHPGIVDMVQYLCQLQDLAQTTKLEPRHRLALHVTVAGILYLIAKMTSNNTLHDHVVEVIGHRQSSAPYLLPDSLFAAETEPTEPTVEDINPELLFQMKDRGILQLSPEPKHGKCFKEVGIRSLSVLRYVCGFLVRYSSRILTGVLHIRNDDSPLLRLP